MFFSYPYLENLIDSHKSLQLLFVQSPFWRASQGTCTFFIRNSLKESWEPQWKRPITLGNNGMAWGQGLHSKPFFEGPEKKEGDGCSTAGLFSLGPFFGKKAFSGLKLPYIYLHESIEAIDDPSSVYYNRILDRRCIQSPDWKTSEKMNEIDLYELGISIGHNLKAVPNKGSAIFIHLWRGKNDPTAGCIGMEKEVLEFLFSTLDSLKNPLLLQFPSS